MERKKVGGIERFSSLHRFWAGATYVASEANWAWENSRENFDGSFVTSTNNISIVITRSFFLDFTAWESSIENIGCPNGGVCTTNQSLLLRADAAYVWNAGSKNEPLPYICVSKCIKGYLWHPTIQRCLKVVHDENPVSIGTAAVSCAAEGAKLATVDDCGQLHDLARDIFERRLVAGER